MPWRRKEKKKKDSMPKIDQVNQFQKGSDHSLVLKTKITNIKNK